MLISKKPKQKLYSLDLNVFGVWVFLSRPCAFAMPLTVYLRAQPIHRSHAPPDTQQRSD